MGFFQIKGALLIITGLLLVPLLSAQLLEGDTYILGESIRIDARDYSDFSLTIVTPSQTYKLKGSQEMIPFKPEEPGDYSITLQTESESITQTVRILQPLVEEKQTPEQEKPILEQPVERPFFTESKFVVNEPVEWVIEQEVPANKEIEVPVQAKNIQLTKNGKAVAATISENTFSNLFTRVISLNSNLGEKTIAIQDDTSGEVIVTYETDPATSTERTISATKKEVVISSPAGLHYENVRAYTQIPEMTHRKEALQIYWKEEDTYLDFDIFDTDGDGLFDYIEWTVPHLSEQTFEIIVITDALLLDSNRNVIADIFSEVSALDGLYSPAINPGEFIRVTFEQNLTEEKDITVFPRIISGEPSIEVYEEDGSEIIATFTSLVDQSYNTVFLTGLQGIQDTFDLKILGGILEFDHIIDPQAGPGEATSLVAQICDEQNSESSQNNFPTTCTSGSYPGTCASGNDDLSCDDGNIESATSRRTTGPGGSNDYGGVRVTVYNSGIADCDSIDEVFLCYEFYGESSQHTCTIGVNADGTWDNDQSVTCSATAPGVTCVNVTTDENWACGDFFGATDGSRAMAKAQAQKTAGSGSSSWRFDVLYFNVSYTTAVPAVPVVTLLNPTDEAYISTSPYYFYTNITDAVGLANVTLYIWNGTNGVVATNTTLLTGTVNQTNLSLAIPYEGNFSWNYEAYNTNGNGSVAFTNYSFIFDTTSPIVSLVDPQNSSTLSDPFDFQLTYNVTDTTSAITSCTLYVNGIAQQTDTSITQNTNQTWYQYLDNGTPEWYVSCTDATGNIGVSENNTITVNVNIGEFDERLWETGTQDFTDETGLIRLNNTRDASINTAAFTISPITSVDFVNATSYFMSHNGAVIPSGTIVDFSSSFTVTSGQVEATWKLFITNSTGDTLLCQNGDGGSGGEPINLGTETSQNTTCISSDIRLQSSDRIKLVISGYNTQSSQDRSITHAWDGATSSYVDINISTEGFITTDLVDPLLDPNVATGGTFNATCQVLCSIGTCSGVDVYIQRNSTSETWTEINSSGNLILTTGQSNPVSSGNVLASGQNISFSIDGNIQSSENHIRCIAIGTYDSDTGTTQTQVTVTTAGAAAPTVQLTGPANETWFNTAVELLYNVSDVNDNLANSTLILNGIRNLTNQSTLLNGEINNFTLNLPDGTYTWTVNATDTTNLEGTNTSERTFYVDTIAPQITLSAPSPNEIFEVSTIEFNFTALDAMDSILSCDIIIDSVVEGSSIPSANASLINYTISNIGLGDHLWNVTCVDEAGNVNTSLTRNFSIADTPPNVALITADNSFSTTGNITLIYNATDNNGLRGAELILNGAINLTNQTTVSNGVYSNFTLIGYPEGIYTWTVNVTDTNGLNATNLSIRTFTIDTNAPIVNLTYPPNNTQSNTGSLNFNFTVIDTIDTALTCSLFVGEISDLSFAASNGTEIERSIAGLTDGFKAWNVTCLDDASNQGLSQLYYINISEPPTVELATDNNTFFNVSTFNLSYIPSDNTNLASCELYIDGVFNQTNQSSIVNGAQNNFSVEGSASGAHTWFVNCIDTIGLQNATENRTFTVDFDNINITLFSPQDGAEIFDDTITFSYNATDDIDPLLSCNINVNSQVVDSFNATNGAETNRTVVFSTGGLKIWNVTCFDDALNSLTSETRNFTLAFAPVVNLTTPTNNTFYNTATVSLFYNVTDDNNNIANATLILNGVHNQTNQSTIINGDINNFTVLLPDGIYNWTVNVSDLTSLEGSDNITRVFTVDTQEPIINLTAPAPNQTLDWNNVSLDFVVSDNIDSSLTCNVSINGFNEFENIEVANGVDTTLYTVQQDGTFDWYAECVDDASNYNITATRNFTIEAPPRINLISPTSQSFFNISNLSFVYVPEDPIDITNCSLYIDGVFNQSDLTPEENVNNTFTVTGIAEGFHNWSVQCVDAFPDFNLASSNISNFTIDNTPPNVTLITPLNNYNTLTTTLFNFSVIDTFDTSLSCSLSIDGVVNQSGITVQNGTSSAVTVAGLALGPHTWNVSCIDEGPNTGYSETWNFNVTYPDFDINTSDIVFSNTAPIENETIQINATIRNTINVTVQNLTVQFFEGDPDDGGTQIGSDQVITTFGPLSSETISIDWNAAIGTSFIFVLVDPPVGSGGVIVEWDELNNEANASITVGGWHIIIGDITALSEYQLADLENSSINRWNALNFEEGNLFVADSESSISWTDLQAIGRNATGDATTNDITEIDSLLGMTAFADSFAALYLNETGGFVNTTSYLVFNNFINQVPITNSTNNTNFATGIMWDTSDDTNGEFDTGDQEDLILLTAIQKDQVGAYGTYDYELRVAAKLREYFTVDSQRVIFYSELR